MLSDLTAAAQAALASPILALAEEHIGQALLARRRSEEDEWAFATTYGPRCTMWYEAGRAGGLLRALRELGLWSARAEELWLQLQVSGWTQG